MASKTASVSVRVPQELAAQLDALAAALDRPKSWVVEQALTAFVEHEAWFVGEVREGIAEAERGDFASPDDVAAARAKWRA